MDQEADKHDPFKQARQEKGVLRCPFQGEEILMVLRHADVKEAAKDWQTFSSDAPFRVPIPSEEDLRKVRQLPIETDPPEHGEYRKIAEPFFKRAKLPEVVTKVEGLVDRLLLDALGRDSIEVVREFALPLQSLALTYLLDVPEEEAKTWISWGIHVFHDGDASEEKGGVLHSYLEAQFDKAAAAPGDDFFSALCKATYQDRPLTRDEMLGFANLTFAGGRDTVIHTISSVFAHLAEKPSALEFLREDPGRIALASEEFFRVATPLTHIGRVCPAEAEVHGETVEKDSRISLCWASANQDEAVFDAPEEVRLDRKPNPHIAFGAGPHICLGAPHARLVVRSLIKALVEKADAISLLEAEKKVEREARYERVVGYERLVVRLTERDPS